MKSLVRSITAASVLALGIGAAQAADLTYEPAPVAAPEVFNWTGFYIGVHGGVGTGSFDSTLTGHNPNGPESQDFLTLDENGSGGFGGAQIGYNWQFNPNWVAGVEADIAASGIESKLDIGVPAIGGAGAELKTSIDWFGTIRGRIGYAWDNLLIYGTAGAAYGEVETSLNASLGGPSFNYSHSDWQWGWTAGAGVEYAITKNISLKTEYLYVDLGSFDALERTNVSESLDLSGEVDTSFHTLKAGLNYKF